MDVSVQFVGRKDDRAGELRAQRAQRVMHGRKEGARGAGGSKIQVGRHLQTKSPAMSIMQARRKSMDTRLHRPN